MSRQINSGVLTLRYAWTGESIRCQPRKGRGELNSLVDVNCSLDRSHQHARADLHALDESLLAFSACESAGWLSC